jgi:hypothetical protein
MAFKSFERSTLVLSMTVLSTLGVAKTHAQISLDVKMKFACSITPFLRKPLSRRWLLSLLPRHLFS